MALFLPSLPFAGVNQMNKDRICVRAIGLLDPGSYGQAVVHWLEGVVHRRNQFSDMEGGAEQLCTAKGMKSVQYGLGWAVEDPRKVTCERLRLGAVPDLCLAATVRP